HSHKKRRFFAFSRMVARAFPIDFGESGATLQGAFRVLDRILSLGVVSDSTGISPTQLPGDRLLARVDGTLVWSIHPESLINSDMPVGSRTGAVFRRWRLAFAPRSLWECLSRQTVKPFPAPATSHPACRFPALGAPVCLVPRVMWLIVLDRLSWNGSRIFVRFALVEHRSLGFHCEGGSNHLADLYPNYRLCHGRLSGRQTADKVGRYSHGRGLFPRHRARSSRLGGRHCVNGCFPGIGCGHVRG